jgi:NADH-quinone oxidoreductase subunit C
MSADPVTTVAPGDWLGVLIDLQEQGLASLDLLTAVDRGDEIEVVARLMDAVTGSAAFATTRVPSNAPVLPTCSAVLPAAAWHERETAEMFGVVFDGHPDPRPLLLRSTPEQPPLRKAAPLTERVTTPYPGAPDEGARSRRPQLPPGVRADWLATGDE